MPPLRCVALLFVAAVLVPRTARGQEDEPSVTSGSPDVRVTIGGALQTRVHYGLSVPDEGRGETTERFGVGIRRARLRVLGRIGPRAGVYFQLEGADGTVSVLDFYAQYQATDRLRLRIGRLVSAQPRGLVLTGLPYIDAEDRIAIAEQWARTTIGGDGRDFGLDARLQFDEGEILVFLHNGDGSWDRLRGNYRPSLSSGDVTGTERAKFAVTGALAYRPSAVRGLEIGSFGGYNNSANPNTRRTTDADGRVYATYGAHVYWGALPGSQPVRLKADLIGTVYESDFDTVLRRSTQQHRFGVGLLGAVRLHRAAEVFGQGALADPDTHRDGAGDLFVRGGVNVSPSALRGQPFHHERLTLGYGGLIPDADGVPSEHLFFAQVLFVF